MLACLSSAALLGLGQLTERFPTVEDGRCGVLSEPLGAPLGWAWGGTIVIAIVLTVLALGKKLALNARAKWRRAHRRRRDRFDRAHGLGGNGTELLSRRTGRGIRASERGSGGGKRAGGGAVRGDGGKLDIRAEEESEEDDDGLQSLVGTSHSLEIMNKSHNAQMRGLDVPMIDARDIADGFSASARGGGNSSSSTTGSRQ